LTIQDFGETLAGLRKEKKLSQTELANHLNITHQAVSKWERGESWPDIETVVRLSTLFDITVDDLLKGKKEKQPPKEEEAAVPTLSDADHIWTKAQAYMQERISGPSYRTWIASTSAVFEEERLVIICCSQFQREWLKGRYMSLMAEALEHATGKPGVPFDFR